MFDKINWGNRIGTEINFALMTTTQFFRSCRELVELRWARFLKKHGRLYLIHVADYLGERYDLALDPIVAVAKDRFGSGVRDSEDVHSAAESLGLTTQNATLLHSASFFDKPPDERVKEVCSEMLAAVENCSFLIAWFRG